MSGYIDFSAVKQNVPIEAVCEKYGHPLGDSGDKNQRGQCPLPNHKGNRRDTFSVNREKNVWICFGCGRSS